MKKINLNFQVMKYVGAITMLIFLLSSCGICIEGEGIETEEKRELEDFSEVEIDIDADVIIHIGNQSSIDISAQENLLDIIRTDVSSGMLIIDANSCISSNYPVNIDISTPSLSYIKLNGSADITVMDELHNDDLEIKINGSGNITADVFANDFRVQINGSGNVMVSGAANDADININGSGDVRAAMLQAYQADIKINGSGNTIINVLNDLKVTVKGSGDVKYSGTPSVKTSISGSGSVTKIN